MAALGARTGAKLPGGLLLTGFFEDRWFGDTFVFSRHSPIAFATRAVKPPLASSR